MAAPFPSFDRYAVEAELGSGSFGAVYRARHLVLNRLVALKVLHPQRASDAEVTQRFLREARAVAGLGSPYIVQVLDADVSGEGRAFIAMELLEGEDLAARLKKTSLMPSHAVLRIGREILAALVVAHGQGVVHRDLKPGNVFLARGPQGETAKVLDFGISKVRTEAPVDELTRTGTMLGTPHYMAPEQFRSSRDVDGRADLYSLGVLLYETLAGRLPYDGATLHQLIAAKLTDPTPPLSQVAPHVPRAIADVVMRALETEPDKRYASAAEMDAALAAVESRVSAPGVVLGSSGRPAPMVSSAPLAAPGSRVFSWVLLFGGIAVFLAFTLLSLALLGAVVAQQQIGVWWHGATEPPASLAPAAPVPTFVPLAPLAPMPTAIAPPPSAASSGVSGVRIVGTGLVIDSSLVQEVADRARPTLASCRRSTSYRESIHMTVQPDGSLAGGTVSIEGATHDCVADAIRAAGPVRVPTVGVAMFDVTLDPL